VSGEAVTPRRPARLRTDTDERLRRVAWPRRTDPPPDPPRVSVVTVNYNTGPLVARLIFSVCRVLAPPAPATIVVVDNGSTDGSGSLLGPLADAGIVQVVDNVRRPYHGPGLNRGVSFLARAQRDGTIDTDLVWALDSDVAVLRAAVAALRAGRAVMVGQEQPYDQARPRLDRYAHPASLLFDPRVVWRHSVPAFLEDGAPAVMMQHVLRRRGRRVVDHPFFADGYLLHLGGGTLGTLVRDGLVDNRYHDWGLEHGVAHYHGNRDGAALHARFESEFTAAVPELTGDALVAACRGV
jgi:glycosyltransferase involved in cell wall biosynthesis